METQLAGSWDHDRPDDVFYRCRPNGLKYKGHDSLGELGTVLMRQFRV
jgi:hypothetical protein